METRAEIESRVCEITSEAEPYRFAWIGEHDSESETVIPRAAAGIDSGYLDAVEITTDDSESGRGPTGRAVRTRELQVMQNIPENDEYDPWREDALERGYRSSAAVPIVYDDTLYGVLNVYADRTHAFDQRERELLLELAGDVAHAICHAEIQARQRRQERVLNNLPIGVYRATPGAEGRVVDANPALADVFDAESADDMIGRKVTDFYTDPEDRLELSRQLEKEGIVRNVELPQETIAGEEIWVAVTAIRTEEDGEVYFDGSIREITERKERERRLRLFRNAVEASGHSIYFTDVDGTIQYVNPAFEEISGHPASEAIGETPRILQSGEHDEAFYEEMWETILSGEIWRNEIVNTSKSGERYVVDQTIAPVEGESGDVTHFVAVNADITEHKERERKLERSREQWRALFESSPDAIAVHDASGDVIAVNEQNVENLGYTREELLSMNVADFDVENTREELRGLWAAMDVGERAKVEGKHRRKDGSTFPVAVWVTKTEFGGETRFVALGRDITERKAYEDELEQQNERLEAVVDVIGHDLRNPLNVLEGRLSLLDEEYRTEHLVAAERALERAETLLEDLRVLADIGDPVQAFDSVDLSAAVLDCWQTIPTEDATLDVGTNRTVRADRRRLRHLLENLLGNAVEHGGPDVTVTVGDLEGGFYVEDDGQGIPIERRGDVFESGFSTTDRGAGLGLSIVEQVVEAHDWEIDVTGSDADGTRFEITSVEFDGE
jgi:PAS domain S-box-containing protein